MRRHDPQVRRPGARNMCRLPPRLLDQIIFQGTDRGVRWSSTEPATVRQVWSTSLSSRNTPCSVPLVLPCVSPRVAGTGWLPVSAKRARLVLTQSDLTPPTARLPSPRAVGLPPALPTWVRPLHLRPARRLVSTTGNPPGPPVLLLARFRPRQGSGRLRPALPRPFAVPCDRRNSRARGVCVLGGHRAGREPEMKPSAHDPLRHAGWGPRRRVAGPVAARKIAGAGFVGNRGPERQPAERTGLVQPPR
mmetsp:Transcript_19238/g.48879  ORF Transcript_19238/g.48879 Transcript_19238/m.48879 type:complete len:248 (+) Transcript_19238:896-1639(+)